MFFLKLTFHNFTGHIFYYVLEDKTLSINCPKRGKVSTVWTERIATCILNMINVLFSSFAHPRHGKGRMVFLSSASYEGRWQYDAMEGNGCLLYPDGCSQEGEWTKGLIDGRGLFTWPDGMMEYREYTMGEGMSVAGTILLGFQ